MALGLGMASDNVNELTAELARQPRLDFAAREEMSQNKAHFLAGIVLADGPVKEKPKL